ncbi:arad-like aldolase/epimerase [Patellaria atrata CBS 101060]|uniref:Arad-like aldolase/epimerase n=1 Tax=Patellaria atrata CBS 101060 TaxID=1346257 RepID=A0A9P4SFJ9_9PEZI|nr:arad-like aldolase/epimerase [Patellaria atrata CBS 101060]
MSSGYFEKRTELELTNLFSGLISANHILHKHGVLDGYGHISVRNPDNHDTFFMSRSMAPALVSTTQDIIEYNVRDGEPEGPTNEHHFMERFIHSELYKKFPNVYCVLHCHMSDVLPYSISRVPLRPSITTAGFLSSEVPVWDINSASPDKHDLLVSSTKLGHAFCAAFAKTNTSVNFIYNKLSSSISGSHAEPPTEPEHSVVLMRGHGVTITGKGIEEVVFKAIYTQAAARAQTSAVTLSRAHFNDLAEGKVESEGGGKIKGGKVKKSEDIHYLSTKEIVDTREMIRQTMARSWPMWLREVDVDPLYVNELKKGP